MSQFKIYNSSAGSGKTYTLTKEYLKLVLNEHGGFFLPDYFKRILAITFTNDAANEMKERVVHTLKSFAEGEKHIMLDQLKAELGLSEKVIRERAKQVFYKLIYNYADFSISTIDSFFNRITTAFTQELNLPFHFEIDLDTDNLLKNVIDSMISRVGTEENESLTQFVIEYATEQVDQGRKWKSIHRNLNNFSKTLLEEKSIPISKGMQNLRIEDFKEIIAEIKDFMRRYEEQIRTHAEAACLIMAQKGLTDKDFYYGTNGIGGYFFRRRNNPADTLPINKYIKKALEEDVWYTAKAKNGAVIDEVKDDLKALAETIEEIRAEEEGTYQTLNQILKHLYTVSLINEIRYTFEQVKMKDSTVHISETNHKIAQIIQKEPIPFIYERLGEKYNHLLIDEFQDTSELQWQNLLPLIENNLAEEHFNMLVGDAKQAIYRWRGGEMEQLVHIANQNIDDLAPPIEQNVFLRERYYNVFSHLQIENLDTNYRSAKEIVNFNNDFFELITQKYRQAENIYNEKFKQKTPDHAPTQAAVEIRFLEQEEYEEETLKNIESIIEEVHSTGSGFARQDIAILCRKNRDAVKIATYLKEKGIEVISNDSLLLSSDEKVNFLLALLRVIEQPENKLAKSEALYLFYKIVLLKIPDTSINSEIRRIVYDPKSTIEDFYAKFAEEGYYLDYNQIQTLGIYEMAEELLITFKIYENHHFKLEYIFRFMDWVLEYSALNSSNLTDFLGEWDKKKGSLSVNMPKDSKAIMITTIHSSKGLEYPVVILPFADWSVVPRPADSMWVNIEQSKLPLSDDKRQKLKHTLINKVKRVADSQISEQLEDEEQKHILENLNLLYVAFTRPIYLLYTLTKMPKEAKEQETVSQWLKSYLENKEKPNGESYWNASQRIYKFGAGKPLKKHKNEHDDTPLHLQQIVSTNTHKKWKL